MSLEINRLQTSVARRTDWMLSNLRALVEIESPTEEPGRVNRAMHHVAALAEELGGAVVVHPQSGFGDVYEIHFGAGTSEVPLLLGHLDTVWLTGSLGAMPWREAEGRLFGPGILDMKAGVLMALTAVASLRDLGHTPAVTLLLNSEEEAGSPVSRPITERRALQSSAVFVLEPAQGLAYKTARKGVGAYTLQIAGVAAHAGVDFDRGHSAVLEAARLIQTVSAWTTPALARTVNAGVVTGGTRSNVVAAQALVEVDVRVAQAADALEVDRLFRALRCTDPACTLTVTGGINRPPMERSAGTVRLFEQAQQFAAELGFALTEASTGGGSDGNFTAALGVPTLDGMGAVGDGAHAAHESILIEHLTPRTTLLAAMIAHSSRRTG